MLCVGIRLRKNAHICYCRNTNVTQDVSNKASNGVVKCLEVSQVLSRVGDKWLVLIIMLLCEKSHRFGELKRGIDGISQRMLTLTLRNMERDGLVIRTVTPSIP